MKYKKTGEYKYYENKKNWNFDMFDIETEELTNWNMYEILKELTDSSSRVLDLGTGGGEKVLKCFPSYLKEVVATDFSPSMIETANRNLKNGRRKNIKFMVMDNLDMDLEKEYFDVVVARNTKIDPKQIYEVLKPGGYLIVRGVDKYDCYELKKVFNYGQGYYDKEPISIVDYNNIIDANFHNTELVYIHQREYYKDYETLIEFLKIVPILNNTNMDNKVIDLEKLTYYVKNNTYNNRIKLNRRYYGIVAQK